MSENSYSFKKIATIHTDFDEKFGIPRQGSLVEELKGEIVFEPEFRNPDVVRGLEEYSHIWLLWIFSENIRDGWSATVRPPRLGGNTRKGVFATRAPFRPNPVGMSAVRLDRVEYDEKRGPVLIVSGADLLDETPIIDIKPYIPYADKIDDAAAGFASGPERHSLKLIGDVPLLSKGTRTQTLEDALGASGFPTEKIGALKKVLSLDPRPSYQEDPDRVYGFGFAGFEIKFRVEGETLHILEVIKK